MIINRQYDCRNPPILTIFFHMGGIWVERHDLRSQASFHHSAIRLALVFLRAPVSPNFGTSKSIESSMFLVQRCWNDHFFGYGWVWYGIPQGISLFHAFPAKSPICVSVRLWKDCGNSLMRNLLEFESTSAWLAKVIGSCSGQREKRRCRLNAGNWHIVTLYNMICHLYMKFGYL